MKTKIKQALVLMPFAVLAINTMACQTESKPSDPGTTSESTNAEPTTEASDVAVSECTTDVMGMVARLTITNQSSKRSTYSVSVTFETPDGGTQLATGFAFVDAVEPGQVASADAHSLTESTGEFTCRVVSVDRMEDVG